MKTTTLLTIGLVAFTTAAGFTPAYAQTVQFKVPTPPRRPDVIFVPTPQEVVNAMLKLAKVQPGELVYDLGCGDGRVVVTAARDFGARGVGVDIDPQRIAESRVNATAAGVTDRVEIKEADLFQMNFSDANVVFLYLLGTLNERLRPRILHELQPGTRIVSNTFDMGEWQADAMDDVDGRAIYFWVVPARAAGQWNLTLPGGERGVLTLAQEFQKVRGTLQLGDRTLPLSDGRLAGKTLTFSYGEGGQSGRATAEISGNTFSGTIVRADGAEPQTWSGQLSL